MPELDLTLVSAPLSSARLAGNCATPMSLGGVTQGGVIDTGISFQCLASIRSSGPVGIPDADESLRVVLGVFESLLCFSFTCLFGRWVFLMKKLVQMTFSEAVGEAFLFLAPGRDLST